MYYFLIGFAAALSFEFIRLYELMGKISREKYNNLLQWPAYWFTVLAMVTASGFLAYLAAISSTNPSEWQVGLWGIGAHTIVRKPPEIKFSSTGPQLGPDDKVSLKDIFSK